MYPSGFTFNDTNYEYSNPNAGNAAHLCSKNNQRQTTSPLGEKQQIQKVLVGKPKTPNRKAKKIYKPQKIDKMSIGTPQHIAYLQFLDCLKRTQKKVKYKRDFKKSDDLIYELLKNSSVVEHESERSYLRCCDAINTIQKFLCPGIWCCRSHCKSYCSRSAYNCSMKRPSVCKEYFDYRKKQIKKQNGGNFYENDEAIKKLHWLLDEVNDLFDKSQKYRFQKNNPENNCAGIYLIESPKSYIAFEKSNEKFFVGEYKKEIDAIESFFARNRYFDRNLATKILQDKQNTTND